MPTATIPVIEPDVQALMPACLRGKALAQLGKYLGDESRRTGQAEAIAFPSTTAETSRLLADPELAAWPVTISGARTGITAGAVPSGGLLVSLERLNRFLGLRLAADGRLLLRCQAGVTLRAIRTCLANARCADAALWPEADRALLATLKPGRWQFPPDPTETGASIGGMVACNASGAHTFLYGPTRDHVHALTAVLADGSIIAVERGQCRGQQGRLFLAKAAGGPAREVPCPTYRLPATKNAAGYAAGEAVEAIDLLIGSEGTLAVVTEVEIILSPAPECSSAHVVFWASEGAAVAFVKALRTQRFELGIEAIEYFDPGAMALLRRRRQERGPASGVPACLPDSAGCAIYLDMGMAATDEPSHLQRLADLIQTCGGIPGQAWSAHTRSERETLRLFRHALPEAVNERIAGAKRSHPAIAKLGTDMAVPDACLERVLALYRQGLDAAKLPYVIFGHIGDNHVHVNILPEDSDQYACGRALYREFAQAVIAMGGSPAAEHGIGRLKTEFLGLMLGEEGIAQMRALKRAFDPASRLNPGVLLP